jgi:hypothetical protein
MKEKKILLKLKLSRIQKRIIVPVFIQGPQMHTLRTTSVFQVPLTEEEEELEVKNTIQQTVSHFTSNTNKVGYKF